MNNELLLLIKKHTDTLIEQTKTKPQETLEFKMSKQMQTFSFNPPINLFEEGKWLIAVSTFECTNSVFIITNENNSFSIIIPGHYQNESDEKTVEKLKDLLELDKKDLSLHVTAVREKGRKIYIGEDEYDLSDLDNSLLRNEKFEKLKINKYTGYHKVSTDQEDNTGCEHVNIDKNTQRSHIDFNEGTQCVSISFTDNSHDEYRHLEDMVYRLQLSYDEIIDILDLKYIPTKRTGYSLNPGIYEVNDLNNTLKHILPDNVEVNITIDDIGLKSNLKINQTLIFTERSFFYTILGFTQSRSYPLDDIDSHYQIIAGSYESNKPINIISIDKIHLKCDCIQGSIVNGIREPILYSFALSSPPGHKIYKEPRVKLFKKINKSILSHITFYFEDDDHKPVDFNGETINFTCQLIKI